MTTDIAQARMRNQRLTGEPCATPEEVVHLLGAVQSQDFGPGKWSIAQRTTGTTDAGIDRAFAAGTILRTHILRPTWHFVSREDIRWMLDLTAPRVQVQTSPYHRNQELDQALLERCDAVLVRSLEGGRHLTRKEIADALQQAGITATSLRLGLILMHAELNGLICSGAPRGKQQTYALLEERTLQARRLDGDEALAELTLRYFTGHGPATVQDFRWWSSLTVTDIKRGIAMVGSNLEREEINGMTYWFARSQSTPAPKSPTVHLLQGYDEYIVGYGESKFVIDESGLARSLSRPRGIYTHAVILDGQIAGQWKAAMKKDAVTVEVSLFGAFDDGQMEELQRAVERYGELMGLPATLLFVE